MNYVEMFERRFAELVGAKYAVAMANGTGTLETALVSIGIRRGDKVCVPPLTHSATSIAVLRAGGIPVYCDIDPLDWTMANGAKGYPRLAVSLYGLHYDRPCEIDDAAQTLRPHNPGASFTSYSCQKSKHLSLGEGGVLTTNDEELAKRARWYSSLGYDLPAGSSKIDPATIKSPDYVRHIPLMDWAVPTNYRMASDLAWKGYKAIETDMDAAQLLTNRQMAAYHYEAAIGRTDWIQQQRSTALHDFWCFPFAVTASTLRQPLVEAMVRNGAEMPFGAWRLAYREPMLAKFASPCPNAERLQPRLIQCQTNKLESAETNARALKKAITELESRSHKQDWKMFEGTIGTPCE